MKKQNCWEFMQCGREPRGRKANELGVCPAATQTPADGFLDGKNGGRACVFITGTFCSGELQLSMADKDKNCPECGFYLSLKQEHGAEMTYINYIQYIRKQIQHN